MVLDRPSVGGSVAVRTRCVLGTLALLGAVSLGGTSFAEEAKDAKEQQAPVVVAGEPRVEVVDGDVAVDPAVGEGAKEKHAPATKQIKGRIKVERMDTGVEALDPANPKDAKTDGKASPRRVVLTGRSAPKEVEEALEGLPPEACKQIKAAIAKAKKDGSDFAIEIPRRGEKIAADEAQSCQIHVKLNGNSTPEEMEEALKDLPPEVRKAIKAKMAEVKKNGREFTPEASGAPLAGAEHEAGTQEAPAVDAKAKADGKK